MKKVINGTQYNTETAKEVADWDDGRMYDDICHEAETLYPTQKGALFLVFAGFTNRGARTNFLKPMSNEDALAWCERRGRSIRRKHDC